MRSLLILSVLSIVAAPALAVAEPSPADAPPPAHAASAGGGQESANTPEEAQKTKDGKFVQDLGDSAISAMADHSLSPPERQQKYRDLLRTSFDMPVIGHFVIGRAWNGASPDQKQEFMKLFEQIVLKTYGDKLDLYTGEQFRVKSVRPESEKDSIVSSEVTHPDGSAPTRIDWRIRQQNDKPEVIDVVVEGVSQSITQRDEYSSIIQRDGGKLDSLLVLMRKQAAQDQTQSQ